MLSLLQFKKILMAKELMIFTYKDEKNKFFPLVIFNSKRSIENQEFCGL